MENSLMIYNVNTKMQSEKYENSLAAVIVLTIGLLSTIATGGNITGEMANVLPMLAATVTSGIFAWVLSYLAANAEMGEIKAEEVLCHG